MDNFTGQKILCYEIIKKLGEGEHGNVYKVLDTTRNRIVAIKLLNSRLDSIDTYRRQCLKVTKKLIRKTHPNICSVFNVHDVDEGLLIVTHRVDLSLFLDSHMYIISDRSRRCNHPNE